MVYYSALHWAAKAEKSAQECENIKSTIGDVCKLKGSVTTVSDLPTNASIGDVYNVSDTGMSYGWTGTEWDSLGGDSSWLSGLGMPSKKAIDLTLGVSGSTYTAPANGWIAVRKSAITFKQYIVLYNTRTRIVNNPQAVDVGSTIDAIVDVKKGDVVKVDYTLGGDTDYFRFIYAEGEK